MGNQNSNVISINICFRVFQIPRSTDNLTQLQSAYPPTDLRFNSASAAAARPTTSRSGRTLTQRFNQHDDSQALPVGYRNYMFSAFV